MPVDQSGVPAKKTAPAKKTPMPQAGAAPAPTSAAPAKKATPSATASSKPVGHQNTAADAAAQFAGSDFTHDFSLKTVLDLGMSFLGQPYVWGGESPTEGFDCSGLVQYIYGKNGVSLPRVAHDQANAGAAVNAQSAQPGDLVLFDNNPNRPGADHVGIYLGGGKMLQAPRTGKNIEVVTVDLGKAMTIRRVAPTKPTTYSGLGTAGGKYVYTAKATPGATKPQTITPAKSGGDPVSNPGGGRTAVPGPLGISTTGTTTPLGGPLPKNATPQQIRDEVARSYGYLAAFLNNPEIGPILTKAAIEDWDEARLTGALTATKWWKTTSDTTRQWDALNKIDPAKAKSQLAQKQTEVTDAADAAGIVLTGLQPHDIAVNALRFGWTPAQLSDALQAQGKHDPRAKTARDADRLAKDDPASYQRLIADNATDVKSKAAALGVTVDDATASSLATQGVREGWDEARYTDALLKAGRAGEGAQGALQTGVAGLRATAQAYLIPVSDQTLMDWQQRILRGQGTAEDFATYVKEQAKALRPWMAKAIDAGVTVAQYAEPLRSLAANELDLTPDQVDFSDPRFARMLDGAPDAKGERRSMTLGEAQDYVRSLDAWKYTKGAREKGAGFAAQLAQTWGRLAV